MSVHLLTTVGEIRKSYPVMKQLRPHLSETNYLRQVQRQMSSCNYKIGGVWEDNIYVALAGFVVAEKLAWGKHLYVDDLVTLESHRSCGYGGKLLSWLIELARKESCASFHLDSGVQRFDAHRFYLLQRMNISSHHFSLSL